MDKKQYNNIIEHTLQYDSKETDTSLDTARTVFQNMGVALPQGSMKEVHDTISTNEYMGWKNCTLQEAKNAANSGVAAMGISEDKIVVLAAEDEEQPVAQSASVMALTDRTPAVATAGLQYYTYSAMTTSNCGASVGANESVIIKKDGAYSKVVFRRSGKTWRCVSNDMIYNEENQENSILKQRANQNLFNSTTGDYHYATIKEYSDKELKLLYAIDPYGVAYYVKRFASLKYRELEDILRYKDRIFKLLYKREPYYYARNLSNTWYVTEDKDNLSAVLSESEMIFGGHPIYDLLTLVDFTQMIYEIVSFSFSSNFADKDPCKNIVKIHKAVINILSVGEAIVKNELTSYFVGSVVQKMYDNTPISYINDIISICNSIEDFVESTAGKPTLHSRFLDYCAYDTGYNVYIQLGNYTHKLDNLCTALHNHRQ